MPPKLPRTTPVIARNISSGGLGGAATQGRYHRLTEVARGARIARYGDWGEEGGAPRLHVEERQRRGARQLRRAGAAQLSARCAADRTGAGARAVRDDGGAVEGRGG